MSDQQEEGAGPKIEPSEEMEEALREATASVEARREGAESSGGGSADERTMEALISELQSMKEEFEARCNEADELTDRYTRLQAEFENFRRRSLKEKQEALQYGQQNLIKDLLATVDNLERALEHADSGQEVDLSSILEGVDLVQREFLTALGKVGVKQVDPAGEAFDPNFHEAMGQIPAAGVEPNSVVQVLQKGYVLQDRMLRPARVLVAAAEGAEKG
ncbi:MAG: nucleotide exchange factor GrpE [Myxococcota bacterium]|nr:nucleotide exchange factor GrpE [Myxococcota bacterium]